MSEVTKADGHRIVQRGEKLILLSPSDRVIYELKMQRARIEYDPGDLVRVHVTFLAAEEQWLPKG